MDKGEGETRIKRSEQKGALRTGKINGKAESKEEDKESSGRR